MLYQTLLILKQTRENLLTAVEGLSNEQLTHIPESFNNSILWNLGHIVASQYLLCYKLTGNDEKLDMNFIDRYRRGSKPTDVTTDSEITAIKQALTHSLNELTSDYENGYFGSTFTAYQTSYGIELHTIEEVIEFNIAHEALHLGYIMAMRHVV